MTIRINHNYDYDSKNFFLPLSEKSWNCSWRLSRESITPYIYKLDIRGRCCDHCHTMLCQWANWPSLLPHHANYRSSWPAKFRPPLASHYGMLYVFTSHFYSTPKYMHAGTVDTHFYGHTFGVTTRQPTHYSVAACL